MSTVTSNFIPTLIPDGVVETWTENDRCLDHGLGSPADIVLRHQTAIHTIHRILHLETKYDKAY